MFIGIGEVAGLITSLSWAGSCQVHTMAGRLIGGVNVTVARVPLYIFGIGLVAFLFGADTDLPVNAFFSLLVSAITGITLCDPLLYSASITIGPRLALLLQSLSACLTAIFGFLFLYENSSFIGWMGIAMATFGVGFVLTENDEKHATDLSGLSKSDIFRGLAMGFLSAVSLACSFLALKNALHLGMDPLWAAFVRMVIGGGLLWGVMIFRGTLVYTLREAWTSWKVLRLLLLGCCVSTVGNCLASVAMKHTQAGIAATLIGLQPVMIIFITTIVDRKPPSARAVVGTLIAFSGTAMIFLR